MRSLLDLSGDPPKPVADPDETAVEGGAFGEGQAATDAPPPEAEQEKSPPVTVDGVAFDPDADPVF